MIDAIGIPENKGVWTSLMNIKKQKQEAQNGGLLGWKLVPFLRNPNILAENTNRVILKDHLNNNFEWTLFMNITKQTAQCFSLEKAGFFFWTNPMI